MERINKYLAQAGVCSRRGADELINQGRVTVNGKPAQSGMQVSSQDKICVNGKQIGGREKKIIVAFYKPVGVTCSEKDRHADKLIKDYVKVDTRVTYAGRLDKDSEGLILMTNDGDLIQKMMKGANRHEKEYVVKTEKEITEEFLEKMRGGIYLRELEKTTRECEVTKEGKYTFRIILTQGLNRQIRRMCQECGYAVKSLKRVRVLNVSIGKLLPGQSRQLTVDEARSIYELVGMEVPEELL